MTTLRESPASHLPGGAQQRRSLASRRSAVDALFQRVAFTAGHPDEEIDRLSAAVRPLMAS